MDFEEKPSSRWRCLAFEKHAWKIKSTADLRLILAFCCYDAGEPEEDAGEGWDPGSPRRVHQDHQALLQRQHWPQINPSFFMMQENLKKMLEKAETLGRHGVSTKTIKLFFNASTDDQLSSAMKQLEGK